MNNLFLKT